MAALTTFLAGLLMMPATVLIYKKFGIFKGSRRSSDIDSSSLDSLVEVVAVLVV
jgi:hypothetical protein